MPEDAAVMAARPIINPSLPAWRISSVDAYGGFVMLLMIGEVFSFRHVSESLRDSLFWRSLYFTQDHVPWAGGSLHETIQPFFSFLVGVALPFSLANRRAKGIHSGALLKSAIVRSLILIIPGIFSRSLSACVSGWFRQLLSNALNIHLGHNFGKVFGDAYSTLVKELL